jgi:hypothetical protein
MDKNGRGMEIFKIYVWMCKKTFLCLKLDMGSRMGCSTHPIPRWGMYGI